MTDHDVPTLYAKLVKVYENMLSEAHQEVISGTKVLVYEGYLTHLIDDAGYSTPFYSRIRKSLIDMGCIAQIRRGGGGAKSRWIMYREPTPELYRQVMNHLAQLRIDGFANREEAVRHATAQQIRALNQRLMQVEDAMGIDQGGRSA